MGVILFKKLEKWCLIAELIRESRVLKLYFNQLLFLSKMILIKIGRILETSLWALKQQLEFITMIIFLTIIIKTIQNIFYRNKELNNNNFYRWNNKSIVILLTKKKIKIKCPLLTIKETFKLKATIIFQKSNLHLIWLLQVFYLIMAMDTEADNRDRIIILI